MDQYGQLIKACLKGDRLSQQELYAIFAPAMFALCLRYASCREEAEDTLQEGFMKVFVHLQQYAFKGSFEGWVKRIIVNTALEKFRGSQRLYAVTAMEDLPDETCHAADALSQMHAKELIALVQELPVMCRLVFNLYVFEGYKHSEIAELLHISDGTSKSNLHDARKILQRQTGKNLVEIKQRV